VLRHPVVGAVEDTDPLERYRPWFDGRRRLRQLTKDLEVISLHAANRIEQWGLPD